MNFSERTHWNLAEDDLAAAVRLRRSAGRELFDLTVSNPTHCQFAYDGATLTAPLANTASLHYEPDPLGTIAAREAVALYYRDAGAEISPAHLCLTTSTSEAYSFLFRLLCDADEDVLVARPSYPLFDFIARLDDAHLREYPLLYDPNSDLNAVDSSGHGWAMDFHALEAAITAKTRAIIVVHPNNPTGNFASAAERLSLETLCAERGLALIVDEVFLDYPILEYPIHARPQSFVTGESRCLTFVLSGISKVCGLPQMKVSWVAACGPSPLVNTAMQRIEIISDTFLSMNAPAQLALPVWLRERHGIQHQIRERVRWNLAKLDERLCGTSAQRLATQAGWAAVLRVPRTIGNKTFAEAALERGVVVQPGDFYGLGEGRVVLSLLTPPEVWSAGLGLLPVD